MTQELTVVAAVERDLAGLAERAPALAESTLAATALALARSMDDPKVSATAKSHCATALQKVLGGLFEQAPEPDEDDEVDELKRRPDARGPATTD